MSFQTTRSSSETLEEIRNHVGSFKRTQLVPGRPLSQLSLRIPVVLHGETPDTTIWMLRCHFNVKLGDNSIFTVPTIMLSFTTPAAMFQFPVICGIHIPLSMWYNGVPTRHGPEFPSDRREPGFQIGAREVREACHSHLLMQWRVLQEHIPRPPRNSLFGQALVRQYATFVAEKLRYLVFEIPKESWILDVRNLSPIPMVRWLGSMGSFRCSYDGSKIVIHLVLELTRPGHHSIPWRTAMTPWGPEDIDDIRSDVVAQISLEADPPVQP